VKVVLRGKLTATKIYIKKEEDRHGGTSTCQHLGGWDRKILSLRPAGLHSKFKASVDYINPDSIKQNKMKENLKQSNLYLKELENEQTMPKANRRN
jgi:hypothetical protein